MATIMKRIGAKGVSYRVQVKVKNIGSGKQEMSITTWKPPDGMPEREVQRELARFALDFEDKVRENAKLTNAVNLEQTVNEYSKVWLASVKENDSASYYASCCNLLKDACSKIGGYKLKDLNPVIIQRYIDHLKIKNVVKQCAQYKNLKETMASKMIKQIELHKKSGVSLATIRSAMNGNNLEVNCAKKISKALGCSINDLFNIKTETKKYSPQSGAKAIRTLRAMLSMAKRQQLIPHNYASSEYVTTIKTSRKEISCLDEEQSKVLFKGVLEDTDIRKKLAILMILLMGIRRGELCGLEWDDIDFTNETITINRSCTSVAGMGVVTGGPKTLTSHREITMPHSLMSILLEYKEWWTTYTTELGDKFKETQRLFLQNDGLPIYPSTIRYWLQTITNKLGLPSVNVHSLRHTNISIQLMAGVPLKAVSERAGHSSTRVTTDVYWQYFKSSDREAAKAIDNIFMN